MRRVCATLGLIAVLAAPAARTAQVEEQIILQLDSGRTVTALLRRPERPAGPLPTIMLFGGFRGAAQVLELIDGDLPVIRASFAYPWSAPDKVGLTTLLPIVNGFGEAVDDTFDGIRKLTAALRARPDVDADRIIIVGASAGAPFATIGGVRNAIPGVVIVQGFGDVGSVIARQFDLSLRPEYGGLAARAAGLLAHLIVWYLDLPAPEYYAPRMAAGQQVLMVTATNDERVPRRATESLWAALQDSAADAERLDLPGGHLRGAGDHNISVILKRVVVWMQGVDLLPAAVLSSAPDGARAARLHGM